MGRLLWQGQGFVQTQRFKGGAELGRRLRQAKDVTVVLPLPMGRKQDLDGKGPDHFDACGVDREGLVAQGQQ